MVAAASGNWERAEEHLRVALDQSRSLPNVLEEPSVHFAHAKLLIDRGAVADRDRAAELLDLAVAGHRRIGSTLREELAMRLREAI